MEEEKQKLKKPSCTKCESKLGYFRLRTKERICRSCGNVDKIEDKNEKED